MNRDVLVVVSVTVACTGAVGALGALAVRRARGVSLVLALVLAAVAPFVAVVLSVWANVGAMFISEHDAWVARVALAASAVPAVAIALVLGRALVADVQAVGARARALGDPAPAETGPDAGTGPMTAELAGVVEELAQTRRRLTESRARERALESSRRQVVAFVSHDLRAPLAGVKATVEALQDGVLADPAEAYVGIAGAVDRMGRMLDDLSEISRADGAPAAREPGPVRLAGVLDDVVLGLAPAAAARGVALEVDVDGDLEVVGVGDDLARVLDNLLGNAIRSSGPGGAVHVAGRLVAGQARIAIADTCGGIPSADLDHVFDAGWQGSPHGVRGSEGLGLAIVDKVVAEHGGRVAVEPTAQGCLFEVSLPGRAAAVEPAPD